MKPPFYQIFKTMKIAIIGSGGREHALAWKLAQTVSKENVFTLPGNGGIPNSFPIDVNDFSALEAFCHNHSIELIVVGPEVLLDKGIVDFFRQSNLSHKTNIKVFGPTQATTQLESSKIYSKDFMNKYGVATAFSHSFSSQESALDLIRAQKGDLVLKYDGLAAGKGVFVCENEDQVAEAFVQMEEKFGPQFDFLIEERLIGDEISIIGITNGSDIQLFQAAQDHKQLLDGDLGPNTGGMGVFSPVPFCDESLMQTISTTIIEPTIKGIQAEKLDYKGFIFFGIMLTTNGPKLLEYNVRFGDPEAEVMLPALETDLLDLILSTIDGKEYGELSEKSMIFKKGAFVDVVQVSGGYPGIYKKGLPISGLEDLSRETLVFHAGTKKENDQIVTNGGRVLNIVTQGETLKEAIQKAYAECAKVGFEACFFRKDIGTRKKVML